MGFLAASLLISRLNFFLLTYEKTEEVVCNGITLAKPALLDKDSDLPRGSLFSRGPACLAVLQCATH